MISFLHPRCIICGRYLSIKEFEEGKAYYDEEVGYNLDIHAFHIHRNCDEGIQDEQ